MADPTKQATSARRAGTTPIPPPGNPILPFILPDWGGILAPGLGDQGGGTGGGLGYLGDQEGDPYSGDGQGGGPGTPVLTSGSGSFIPTPGNGQGSGSGSGSGSGYSDQNPSELEREIWQALGTVLSLAGPKTPIGKLINIFIQDYLNVTALAKDNVGTLNTILNILNTIENVLKTADAIGSGVLNALADILAALTGSAITMTDAEVLLDLLDSSPYLPIFLAIISISESVDAMSKLGVQWLNNLLDDMKAAVNALINELVSLPGVSSAVQKLLNYMKTH